MAKPIHATEQDFRSQVESSPVPVLVDFWAEWCGPCRMIAPVLEQIGEEQGEKVKILKVNVDEHPGPASEYGVFSIPTLILLKNGQPAERLVGYMPKQALMSRLSKHLS
jgi:thioredoxin